jgi:hypothetical protein
MLRQAGLPQNSVGRWRLNGIPRDGEISTRDRAVPDLMGAFALPNEIAPGFFEKSAKLPVELGAHLGDDGKLHAEIERRVRCLRA